MAGERSGKQLSFGEFVEQFREYLFDLGLCFPGMVSTGLCLAFRHGFEPVDHTDRSQFLTLALELDMSYKKGDGPPYKDGVGNSHHQLEPHFFTKINSLTVHASPTNGAPKISFTHDSGVDNDTGRWGLSFQGFSAEIPEAEIDSVIEHGFEWWSDIRTVRTYKAPRTFRTAVQAATPNDAKSDLVYWKNWHWNQPLSTGPVPALVSQYESNGGVWTVVDGADEASADPQPSLVAACAEATRISLSSRKL